MKQNKLNQGKFALVDNEDFEYLNQWIWFAHKGWSTNYARAFDFRDSKKPIRIYMHRMVLKAKKEEMIDHINRDGLDNRKNNLRIVNPTQNNLNQKLRKDNKSGYKGIWWNKKDKKWIIELWRKNKKYYFGRYKELEEAIFVRNSKFHFISEIV